MNPKGEPELNDRQFPCPISPPDEDCGDCSRPMWMRTTVCEVCCVLPTQESAKVCATGA
jgi:hypothetical protein